MNIIQQEDLQPMNGFGLFPKRYACAKADDATQYLIHSASKDIHVVDDVAAFFDVEHYNVVEI